MLDRIPPSQQLNMGAPGVGPYKWPRMDNWGDNSTYRGCNPIYNWWQGPPCRNAIVRSHVICFRENSPTNPLKISGWKIKFQVELFNHFLFWGHSLIFGRIIIHHENWIYLHLNDAAEVLPQIISHHNSSQTCWWKWTLVVSSPFKALVVFFSPLQFPPEKMMFSPCKQKF